MNRLLGMLILQRCNFQILHWNVRGNNFDNAHKIMDNYVQMITSDIDVIGELCVICNKKTVGLLEISEGVLQDGPYKSLQSIKYSESDCYKYSYDAFIELKNIIDKLIQSDKYTDDICDELKILQMKYRKEALYFNKQRI